MLKVICQATGYLIEAVAWGFLCLIALVIAMSVISTLYHFSIL